MYFRRRMWDVLNICKITWSSFEKRFCLPYTLMILLNKIYGIVTIFFLNLSFYIFLFFRFIFVFPWFDRWPDPRSDPWSSSWSVLIRSVVFQRRLIRAMRGFLWRVSGEELFNRPSISLSDFQIRFNENR